MEGGVEEGGGGGLLGGELGFELVAPAQQLRHLRDDPLLLGQGYFEAVFSIR